MTAPDRARPSDDVKALGNLHRLLNHVWPSGWDPAWGPAPRPEDLRKLLGYTHPHHAPAVYRGMTGMGSTGPVVGLVQFGVSLMTLDGEHRQFMLTDVDLRRLADDIALRLPGWFGHRVADAIDRNVAAGYLAWTDGAQSTRFQSEQRDGNRPSADTDCGGSALDANNASRAP